MDMKHALKDSAYTCTQLNVYDGGELMGNIAEVINEPEKFRDPEAKLKQEMDKMEIAVRLIEVDKRRNFQRWRENNNVQTKKENKQDILTER